MIEFVDLHTHSTFSPMDGIGTAEQVRDRLEELGQKAMGLTDHGTSAGHPEFFRVFNAAGLKLVPGVEFYHCEDMAVRGVKSESNQEGQRTARASLPHLTVLALNQQGYQNLLKLHKLSYREGFYYRPRIDTPTLIRHQEGLAVFSGCVGGQIARLINADKEDLAFKWLSYFKQSIQHFYAEITPISNLDISERHCRVLWKMAGELKIDRVVTSDAHFPRPEDYAAEDTMTARAIGVTVNSPDRKLRLPAECYRCTGEEILDRLKAVLPDVNPAEFDGPIAMTQLIADACTVEPPRASGPVFNVAAEFAKLGADSTFQSSGKEAPEVLLRAWVSEGRSARRKQGELPKPGTDEWAQYLKREEYEFDILKHHGFINYLLVVGDLARWAREQNILCVARGSCGGSLLCWYLGITELDPIKCDLPVERFIGFHRKGLPDIDLDVDARYRDRFWKYLNEKYGEENCAQIAALSRFRARQALRDVASAHELPDEVLAEMLDLAPEAEVADEGLKATGTLARLFANHPRAQALAKEFPPLLLAAQLEGQIRQSTVHAAGFVVDARPIHETVGIMGKPTDLPVAACDMVEAEKLGLLKIDLLAVDMLSVLAAVAEGLGKPLEWIRSLSLDDPETYQMLAEGRNAGVFQLQGTAAGRLLRDLQPTQYEDVLAVTVLARPGPLQSGSASTYGARRRGAQPAPEFHPILAAILQPTFGIVLYQEQVMQVMREAGGFDWDVVEKIRKIISKIEGAHAMEPYLESFLQGAEARGIPERDARVAWDQCLKAGNYSFNRAHGAAYAKIAVWSAYLKRHHPAQFAAAYARFQEDPDLRRRIFTEFQGLGGKFVLIDPNRSAAHFTVLDDTTILGGFQDLEGCGPKTAEALVAKQPFEDWDAFFRACPKTLRDRLYATGVHEGRVDEDAVLHVAPWYATVTYTELEQAAAARMGATTISRAGHQEKDVKLVGRVVQVEEVNVVAEAKKYGQRPPAPGEPVLRAVITLADETGSTLVHVNPRRMAQLVAERNPLRGPYGGVGNSVYCVADWNRIGTKLYANDLICFREAPEFVPATPEHLDPVKAKKATTKRKKKSDEPAQEPAQSPDLEISSCEDGSKHANTESEDVGRGDGRAVSESDTEAGDGGPIRIHGAANGGATDGASDGRAGEEQADQRAHAGARRGAAGEDFVAKSSGDDRHTRDAEAGEGRADRGAGRTAAAEGDLLITGGGTSEDARSSGVPADQGGAAGRDQTPMAGGEKLGRSTGDLARLRSNAGSAPVRVQRSLEESPILVADPWE